MNVRLPRPATRGLGTTRAPPGARALRGMSSRLLAHAGRQPLRYRPLRASRALAFVAYAPAAKCASCAPPPSDSLPLVARCTRAPAGAAPAGYATPPRRRGRVAPAVCHVSCFPPAPKQKLSLCVRSSRCSSHAAGAHRFAEPAASHNAVFCSGARPGRARRARSRGMLREAAPPLDRPPCAAAPGSGGGRARWSRLRRLGAPRTAPALRGPGFAGLS